MKTTILAALLVLAGCGHHHHATTAAPPPPPTPFADIAGTYLATCTFGTGNPYDPAPIGQDFTVTITAAGKVTVGTATYTLTRLADGSFQTKPRSVPGLLWEVGTAPADLSSFHLNSSNAGGVHYGMEDFAVVKLAGG